MSRKYRKRKNGANFFAKMVIIIGVICIAAGLVRDRADIQEKAGSLKADLKETVSKKLIDYQEVEFDENELAQKYHYGLLEEEKKVTYREIVQGIRDGAEEITVHGGVPEDVNRIFEYVIRDFPEFFFCDGSVSTSGYTEAPGREAYCVMKPGYAYSGEEREKRAREIETAAEVCLSQISPDASEYEKVRFIFEYIIDTVQYQLDSPDDQNIYSALVSRQSVCTGYAKSMQYLLERLGMVCIYVTGESTDSDGKSGSHAWNIVRCDGNYYCVDVTWGDQDTQEEIEIPLDKADYTYLCCTDAELAKSHKADANISYPECISDYYDYYKMNGMYFDYFDYDIFMEIIRQDIERGDAGTVFKFSDDSVYAQAHDMMTQTMAEEGAQYLGEIYGLSRVSYSYRDSSFQKRIILYWNYS